MTVLDFRSGGYADARDGQLSDDAPGHATHWHGARHGEPAPEWHPDWHDDDWDATRYAAAGSAARLSDREGVLGRVARLTHYLGALVSVGLMVGLAVWGYQLIVRDVSGVPVIRAVEGEARTAPDEPGGELTDRTGLAVNTVAGGGNAKAADKVAIAPAPTALDGQDVAMGELGATAQNPTVTSEAVEAPAPGAIALTDNEAARLAAEQQATVPAVAPLEADSIAASAAVTDVAGLPTQDTAITAALAEAGAAPAVTTPTRPLPRPRRIAAASQVPVANDAAPLA
ncbi:SPOR domain-containing protein, partial [Paracoccus panacisoli]